MVRGRGSLGRAVNGEGRGEQPDSLTPDELPVGCEVAHRVVVSTQGQEESDVRWLDNRATQLVSTPRSLGRPGDLRNTLWSTSPSTRPPCSLAIAGMVACLPGSGHGPKSLEPDIGSSPLTFGEGDAVSCRV